MAIRAKQIRTRSQQEPSDLGTVVSLRLRRWRKARRIPLKQMASGLGVSVSLVSAWETGVRIPSIAQLMRLSAYTGVPVCQFLYAEPLDCPNGKSGFDPAP